MHASLLKVVFNFLVPFCKNSPLLISIYPSFSSMHSLIIDIIILYLIGRVLNNPKFPANKDMQICSYLLISWCVLIKLLHVSPNQILSLYVPELKKEEGKNKLLWFKSLRILGLLIGFPLVLQVLKIVRKDVLKGCKIVFSRVFPTQFQADNHHLWKTAEQLGATCFRELDPSVTHVVSQEAGTEKSRWALKNNKFLVHPRWIEAANYLWQRQPEENFRVNQPKN